MTIEFQNLDRKIEVPDNSKIDRSAWWFMTRVYSKAQASVLPRLSSLNLDTRLGVEQKNLPPLKGELSSEELLPDWIGGSEGEIWSSYFCDLLTAAGVNNLQFFPIEITNTANSTSSIDYYRLVNVVGINDHAVTCDDKNPSVRSVEGIVDHQNLKIRPAEVNGEEKRIFRIHDLRTSGFLLDNQLKEIIEAHDISGVKFHSVPFLSSEWRSALEALVAQGNLNAIGSMALCYLETGQTDLAVSLFEKVMNSADEKARKSCERKYLSKHLVNREAPWYNYLLALNLASSGKEKEAEKILKKLAKSGYQPAASKSENLNQDPLLKIDLNDWTFWEHMKLSKLEKLLEKGADFGPHLDLAMNYAVKKKVFQKLLNTYPQHIEDQDTAGYSLLWKAAACPAKYGLMLLEAGANIHHKDAWGNSLLAHCKNMQNDKLFNALVERGLTK